MKLPALIGLALFSAAQLAQAQAWPVKPVRMVLALGGGADPAARALAEKLGESLGQPFIVELQAGAGGAIGAEMVARAPADGYTILLASPNSHVNRTVLVKKIPYDPVRDFTPIAKLAETILCITAGRSAPVGSLQDLVNYARQNPGKLSYSTSGIGTGHHLNAEQLQFRTGIRMVHVPYKTGQQQMQDLLGEQVPIAFTVVATALPHVASGKVRMLAIIGSKRFASLPDVPTVQEIVPGYESLPGWLAFFGPAGLPGPLVARLNAEALKLLSQEELRGKWNSVGFVVDTSSPEELAEMLKRQLTVVAAIAKQAGIQPE
jgi:tripartite-type tricarboxylate transporter receptor subunit TctC